MQEKSIETDLLLGQSMLEQAWVSGVPGTEFGLPGYMRFSYAIDDQVLLRAIDRLQTWAKSR